MMRTLLFGTLLLGGVAPALGQAPVAPPAAPAPAPPAVDPTVLATLKGWEEAMTKSNSFYSPCSVVRQNEATKAQDQYAGSVVCLKPGYARTVIMLQPQSLGVYEEYIITPNAVHEYSGEGVDAATKKPKPRNYTETRFDGANRPQNVMLDFLSGTMTAEAALKRFDITLVKTDAHYLYLGVLPRNKDDAADFRSMMLVLYQPTTQYAYLPAQVKFVKDALNQQIETWAFTQPALNHPGITPKQFEPHVIQPGDPNWVVSRRVAGPQGVVPAGVPAAPPAPAPATPQTPPGAVPPRR